MEFRSSISGRKKQWQVGPWPRFLHPHRVERYEKVAEKGCVRLDKFRKRFYVGMG